MLKHLYIFIATVAAGMPLAAQDWNLIGYSGEAVYAIAVHPVDKNVVYAGIKDKGIYKSHDAGLSWTTIFETQKPVYSLAIDRINPEHIYAGSSDGIIVSTTGGNRCSDVFIGINLTVTALCIDETPTKAIILGTAKGIYKSFDSGESFAPAGLTNFRITCLAIDNSGPKAVLYAGTSTAGIFKSANYGTSWTPANTGLTSLEIHSVLCDRKNASILYAGTLSESVYQSDNGGTSWQAVAIDTPSNEGYVFAQAIDQASNTSVVFLTSLSGDVYSIADNGTSIVTLSQALPDIHGTCLGVANIIPSTLYLGTTTGLYKFTD